MIAEINGLFGSRLAPRRSRAGIRRRRPAGRAIAIESLETRKVLNGDTGWIKIDLSQLDQTGVGDAYDIYVQGNSAGMFIQPLDGKLMFARPQPGVDLTLPANPTWTFENPGALFVGGNVTFFDGSTSVGTAKIKSIAANVKVAAYDAGNAPGSRWETTDVFNDLSFSGVTNNALVAINSGGIGTGTLANNQSKTIATLTGFNTPAAGSSLFTLGSVVVGTPPDFMFPNNNSQNDGTNGNGPSWTNPTYVTQIDNYSSSALTADATLSSGATGTLSNSLQVYQNGIGGQYATLPAIPTTSVPVSDANGKPAGQAVPLTIDNLLSTNQLPKTAFPTYDTEGVAAISWQVQFQGNAKKIPSSTGLLPVYSVDSYTVTFDSPAPANATQVTFHAQIGATIQDSKSFTIDTSSSGFPGLSTSTLFIGMPLVITPGTGAASTAKVKALAAAGSTITVTLDEPLPAQFTSGSPVTIALPPTGGTIPATKVDSSSSAANAIWVKQTTAPVEGEGNFSLNGSRIYFSLVPKGSQPQGMTWFSSGNGIAVNQWTPAQIWSGAVPASVYTELTVDDFLGTAGTTGGDVFFDLSGVDGFFFPAGISYQKDAQTEWVVGQPWKNYSAPNTTGPNTYGPVTRSQIIAAFQGFFGSAGGNFSTDANAQALAAQYQALVTKTSDGAVLGIKNPSFAYSSPTSSVPAFDTCWNAALDALFTQGNQIDMIGDIVDPSDQQTLYYKGMSTSVNSSISGVTATGNAGTVTFTLPQGSGPLIPGQTVTISGFANAALNGVFTVLSAPTATTFTVSNASVTQQTQGTAGTVVPSYRAIQFTEYSGDYNSPTKGTFYVFDPRTPPPSETAAFSGGAPMSVGYQVFGNTGVFASTQIVSGGPTPNSNGSSVVGGSALTQLGALQRDIVTALNRGMGGFGIGTINGNVPGAGASTTYWQTQNNWYPYAAPYGAQTPQNIYSQWFHTAVIAQAGQTYTVPATYPLGGSFGDPQKSWGGGVQSGTSGTGPYMNMYYGFGYDEKGRAPSNANTNAQFPGINNTPGNTLSFGVVLGPWSAPAITGISQPRGSVNGGTSVTISGTGFNQSSTVKFGGLAATSVTYTPASGGKPATLTALSPAQAAGTVDITVTTGDLTSATSPADAFTYVATSKPVVLSSAAPLPADAITFTISGEHFSPTKAGNTVTLSSGTAIVQSATATSITLLLTSRPTAGPLTATVRTGGASSGPVQVATVYATVTPTTATVAASGKTLVITGTGFDARTPANNIVTLSSGAGVVTKATATALTISLTTPPQLGPLGVTSLTVHGVQTSGLPVQVATVVAGPASARSTVTASVAEAAVGAAVNVLLQAVDAVGNPVTTGGARVRFTASSSGAFSRVTDNGNGTYTATFTTKRVGSQVFSATVNGVTVTDTATTAFVFTSQFSQPIPGTNWSVARGGFLSLLNTAVATATRNNVALYTGAAARNVTVSANVGNLENGQFGGVVARYSSKTSYYQAGLMLESGQYYAVIQAVGLTGVRTLVKQSVVGPGQGLVSFTLSGTSLSLSLNGFQVAQVTDSRFQSGSVGISGNQAVAFTNFFAG